MAMHADDLEGRIEAAVRRYLARVARRYTPLLIGAVAFALVVTLVPTVDRGTQTAASGEFPSAGGGPAATDATGAASPSGEDAGMLPGSSGSAGSSSVGAASVGSSPAGSASTAAPAAEPAKAAGRAPARRAPSQPGVARSGVRCSPGARQVTFTVYAPPCRPVFTGDNGGATWHGVTKDTVTVTFRRGQSTEDTAVSAAAGDAAPAPDPDFLYDMQAYIDLFNRQYELYGRKVVLKDFQGQGDYIREDQGQGQEQAAQDAQTAYNQGAFADATFALKGSQPFWKALAQQKVVAIGPLGFPDSWYQKYAPYWYTVSPTGTDGANLVVNMTCRRGAGMPAIYAGDAAFQKLPRVFGLVTPENPEYMEIGDAIEKGLKDCGVTLKTRQSYTINVATYQAQATNMAAQFQTQGVTSVICYCDPLVPIFLSNAADAQRYYPEWYEPWYRDPQGRLMQKDQWAHALSNGGLAPPKKQSEAYRAFRLVHPNEEPKEQYFDVAYQTVLFLFNGLQAAGPQLTPVNMQRGLWALPATPTGEYGQWAYQGSFSPSFTTQLGWWNPDATSPADGKQGAWQNCEGGRWFRYDHPEDYGGPRAQLHCFGH